MLRQSSTEGLRNFFLFVCYHTRSYRAGVSKYVHFGAPMDPTFLSFALRENEFFAGTRTGKYKTNQQMRKNRFSTPKQDLYRFNQERSSVRLCSPLRSWTIFCKLQIHCPSQKPTTAISSSSRFDTKSMQRTMILVQNHDLLMNPFRRMHQSTFHHYHTSVSTLAPLKLDFFD